MSSKLPPRTTLARSELLALAEQRYADVVATGKTISWDEMRARLERR